ncbi:Trm112 family protein [Salinisphaera sp. PC39]|uniref:Trm112 family protein n=1 Tax=Salinisphaera sp. PC39 TaxID=1304156 RepID=UPI00333E194C
MIALPQRQPRAMDKKLLDILVCPVTGAALSPLTAEQRDALNARVREQALRYVDGSLVEAPLDDGLITDDRHTVYRVDDDIPVLLPDRGIPFEDAAAA